MVTKYTGSMKYRTDWTIAPDNSRGHGVHWFKGDYDGDPMNTCDTVEEAEGEIDDAIIMEQEAQIGKLKTAVLESTACLRGVQDFYTSLDTPLATVADQIKRNVNLLKQL